jgi:NitT/TauT family transport system permease protein
MAEPFTDQPQPSRLRPILWFVAITLTLVTAWELYKVFGKQLELIRPVRPDNITMPHVWDIIGELFEPARRGGETLIIVLFKASIFTLREAVAGFAIGGSIGFGLGVLFERSRLLERGLMPYVVASQTVPILAIAPMVVVWGGRLEFPNWVSVSVIAAYLTFFPVVINTLRGLRSPDPTAVELMASYAATPTQVLWKLRVPAALPYIFTALKVSATASVIGAIIGELPGRAGDGLGRNLLVFSQQFAVRSPKLYATVIVSALVGIFFVTVVSLVERWVIAQTRHASESQVGA